MSNEVTLANLKLFRCSVFRIQPFVGHLRVGIYDLAVAFAF